MKYRKKEGESMKYPLELKRKVLKDCDRRHACISMNLPCLTIPG